MFEYTFPKEAGGFHLRGRSRAAHETAFYVRELDIGLDAGTLVTSSRPQDVFVSHPHGDHSYLIIRLVSRHKPVRVYLPAEAVELADSFMKAAAELTSCAHFDSDEHQPPAADAGVAGAADAGASKPQRPYLRTHWSKPVRGGDVLELKRGATLYNVRVVDCDHSVPCCGYAFAERRSKLKAEFLGRPGRELGQLRKEGVAITEEVAVPRFVFLGDTTTRVFANYPELLDYPVVIVECTFLYEHEQQLAERKKHVVWSGADGLGRLVREHPKTTFVLIHFSLRYSQGEIKTFFAGEREKGTTNFVLCLDPSLDDDVVGFLN